MMRRLVVLALLAVLVSGCGGSTSGQGDGKLNVVATSMQVGDLARAVGAGDIHLSVLMGPGIDPHQYKASAGDVDRLAGADLILYSGLHLEAKMGDVLERLGSRKPTLAVAASIPEEKLILLDGVHDPHVWFDPELWAYALEAVTARLIELDPAHEAVFRERAQAYRIELDNTHAWCREQAATIPARQRVLITAHDAFQYLGRAYGLEVRGLQGISTLTEAGTGDVQQLAALIAERRIPALFVESSVSPRAIEAVRAAVRAKGFEVEIGGEVFSDAMGDAGTPEGTYLGMLRHNIDVIAGALGGGN